jgi:hypothetical protein
MNIYVRNEVQMQVTPLILERCWLLALKFNKASETDHQSKHYPRQKQQTMAANKLVFGKYVFRLSIVSYYHMDGVK